MEGIYDTIRQRIDYASLVPKLVGGIERADLRHRDGSGYTVLKNPHGEGGAGLYLPLEPEDMALVDLMDGTRSVQDILIAHLQERGVFALDRLARLTGALGANGFFGEERPPVYQRLMAIRARRDPLVKLSLQLRRLFMWDIAKWRNPQRVIGLLYRGGGWLAFTRVGAVVVTLFCAAGVALWIRETAVGRHALVTIEGSYALGLVSLIALQVLSISVHEAGHALAIRHFGRRVRWLGLAFMYLFPCVYVDSTDMAMTPRRQRVIVALAGPIGGVTVGAACAFVAAAEGGIVGGLAYKAASLFIFQFVLNLLPILELDGYHVLVDLLDAPFLRQRAIAFARRGIIHKLRRRQKWTPAELGLAIYGAASIATSLLFIVISLQLWESRVSIAARELLGFGAAGVVVLVAIVVVFIGPLLLQVAMRAAGTARTVMSVRTARLRKAKLASVAERAQLLARVRFLAGLPAPALYAIASHLEVDRVDAGATVITIGEPGDRFYLVRSGRLEVIGADGAVIGSLVPGEAFGELALLDRRPRNATVRALEPCELWTLDRGHFERWVRERFEVAARIRASAEERSQLASLPFFKGLQPAELDPIAARLVTRRVVEGDAVCVEGEPGDRYYLVREGRADVTIGGAHVRRLGPGDGFGELALLFGGPRTATVTAETDMTLAALTRSDFARLVRASGEKVGEFRARTAHYVGAVGLGSAVRGG